MFLSIAAVLDHYLHQMDAITAFLDGDSNYQVFLEKPLRYDQVDQAEWFCCLKKALYGFKQT